jgi:hypothetical protein
MKIIPSARKNRDIAVAIIFLAVIALSVWLLSRLPAHYNLTISSTGGGEVTTPGEGTFTYAEGTVVNLVAEAEEGYYFVNWTGDVGTVADTGAATTTITINGNYYVEANFGGFEMEIWDWYDLDAIRNNLSGSYILMNDLDSTTPGYAELASPTANHGKGWEPIGILGSSDSFTGIFDGQGHEIRDLFVNRPDQFRDAGLFGIVDHGVVENLSVVNVTVIGNHSVGGLVGLNKGTISNSYSAGSVAGNSSVGGLVGRSYDGAVSNSYFAGSVTGGGHAGGLVGSNWGGTVSSSYATGSVTGTSCVGGLVGDNNGCTVSNSYSSGSVYGSDYVGGLVGHNNGCTVSNGYSTGSVTGNYTVGGLVGWNDAGTVNNCYSTGSVIGNFRVGGLLGANGQNEIDVPSTVSNSYSTGSVTGETYVGGLVGENAKGTVSDSFWDTETSGQSISSGGTGKTTAEMQNITTFSGADWNIIAVADPSIRNPCSSNRTYIWNIVDDVTYPFLSWQS